MAGRAPSEMGMGFGYEVGLEKLPGVPEVGCRSI